MTTTDTNLSPLIINRLTQSQYSQVQNPSASELWFITDGNTTFGINYLTGTAITLVDNSVNVLVPSGNVTFTLPTVTDTSVYHQILVQLDLSILYTIDLGTTTYFAKEAPDLSVAGYYNLIYEYDSRMSEWVVGCISKGAVSQ